MKVHVSDSPKTSSNHMISKGTALGVAGREEIWVIGYKLSDSIYPDSYEVLGHEVQHQLKNTCPQFGDPD